MDYEMLGKRIRMYRRTANLTQMELSERVECSDGHIGQIERGKGIPSLDVVVKIANVLKVSLDQLMVDSLEQPERYYLREIAARISAYPVSKRICACEAISAYLDSLERFDQS